MAKPNKNKHQNSKHHGIDALLMSHGKALAVGQEIRFSLVKGPSGLETHDICNAKAPPEAFPVVAKFPESVVKPNFAKFKRFYQQDIPSQKDDSDEEAAIAAAALTRKKRRYRRNEGPRRQWMLQTEEDYLVTMITQKEQGKQYKQDTNVVSSRYQGLPEHNPSHYVLIGAPSSVAAGGKSLDVTMLPTPHAVFSFSQPAKSQTMSMTEAEQAIENQRSNTTRYMMHGRGGGVGQPAPVANSKSRLMGKLKALSAKSSAADDGEDDDVMGDVKFATRKGSGSRARKELLSTLAQGASMDADGVLGGGNDAEFGGRRRFMKMNVQDDDKATAKTGGGAGANTTSNGGMAMADDFYQRDVKAEYEELDYDANEQFDDDDVDMAEGEMTLMTEIHEEFEEDDDIDEDEEDDEDDEKKAGLASIKGLKDMLAKARAPTDANGKEGEKKEENENGNSTSPAAADKKEQGDDSLAKVMAAAELTTRKAEEKAAAEKVKKTKERGVRFDANGQRVLDMESVRYEIFLHNKSIAMKKLMKLYNIKKKSTPERIAMFQNIIRELCNMSKDPVHGNILVLKQHYAKGL